MIHGSQRADGKAQLDFDDAAAPTLTAEGPNMNNDFQYDPKRAMSRHPGIETDHWNELDDLNITTETAP